LTAVSRSHFTSNQQLTTINFLFLSLFLFMLNIRADHPHDTFAANDLAVFTNSADAAANFHDTFPYRFMPPQKGRTGHYRIPYGFFNPLQGLEIKIAGVQPAFRRLLFPGDSSICVSNASVINPQRAIPAVLLYCTCPPLQPELNSNVPVRDEVAV
jgi:hypothetical protein